jgi:hypothetical protein
MLLVEWYLVHTRARSRLQDHLLHTHPSSPSASFVLWIHAVQGPPKSEWTNEDGHDSLKCWAVSKWHICFLPGQKCKRSRSPTPFSYYLKCNEDSPNHYKDDCPLWKVCRWCLATDHAYNDCPTPHHRCIMHKCVVPFWYPCTGDYCLVSYQNYSYAMHCTELDADIKDNQFE